MISLFMSVHLVDLWIIADTHDVQMDNYFTLIDNYKRHKWVTSNLLPEKLLRHK